MSENPIKKTGEKSYEIDLVKLPGNGSFSCPNCGRDIKPDDESEKNYTIGETEMDGENLVSLTIVCKCGVAVRLGGW
jgi:hypothetical protein